MASQSCLLQEECRSQLASRSSLSKRTSAMKHNTKAAAKPFESSTFCANPNIPASNMPSGTCGNGSDKGHQLRFETSIIKSPVLRSDRSHNTSHPSKEDDLGSLTTMMANLQVRGGTSSDLGSLTDKMSNLRVRGNTVTKKSNTPPLPKSTSSTSSRGLTMAPTPPPSPAVDGRYDAVIFLPNKKMQVPVKRSARFRLIDP